MAKASQTAPTAASVEVPISCPSWCTDRNSGCRGEHYGEGPYTPATAGLPRESTYSPGVWFPSISPAPVWNTIDHRPPAVSIHMVGEGVDAQADLQLYEAEALLKSLKRAIKMLRATA